MIEQTPSTHHRHRLRLITNSIPNVTRTCLLPIIARSLGRNRQTGPGNTRAYRHPKVYIKRPKRRSGTARRRQLWLRHFEHSSCSNPSPQKLCLELHIFEREKWHAGVVALTSDTRRPHQSAAYMILHLDGISPALRAIVQHLPPIF